jgi:hypothetical protein
LGVHLHDGFYLRMGLGGGYAGFSGNVGDMDASIKGGGAVLELLIGGSPAPGITIGGGFAFGSLQKPKVKLGDFPEQEANNDLSYGILGIFMDWYPDPRGGFHLQPLLGVANAQADDSSSNNNNNKSTLNGGGAALGVGYDFWVGDQWSIGPEGRFVWASLKNSDSNIDEKYTVTGFHILFSATLH